MLSTQLVTLLRRALRVGPLAEAVVVVEKIFCIRSLLMFEKIIYKIILKELL